jgi:hypothetical protein
VAARLDGRRHVEVAVADRGHGPPAKSGKKLFTPFYTTKTEGMGMGLNICRSIVEYHDGRLWAQAESRRRQRVPVYTAHPLPSPAWRERGAGVNPGHGGRIVTNQRVYIVDDDEAMRDSLVWLLESQGFKVPAYSPRPRTSSPPARRTWPAASCSTCACPA